jgi:GT2 family glycosyltransferase
LTLFPRSIMKVAVVILNWNGINFLRKFLPSVLRHSGEAGIVVADNASSDGSLEMLTREFPGVRQVVNKSNLGFAGGYNEALRHVDAEYFILLNSDVEVTAGWISPVIGMMDKDPSIAACQPKVLAYNDKSSFEYAGAAGGFIDKLGYPFCRGRLFDSLEKDEGQYDDARRIFWATGACMFVRAAAFNEVGGFDESFFAHMEEIDLCWRLQRAGGSVWYCPGSAVYHVGGGTLHKSNPHKTYLNFRNNLMMLYKNLSRKEFEKVILPRTIFDFLAAVKFFFSSGGWKEARAVWEAHRDFNKMREKLRQLKADQDPDGSFTASVVYPKSILRDYYLGGKRKFSQLGF